MRFLKIIVMWVCLLVSGTMFGQKANIHSQTLNDIKQIDSLFRQIETFYWAQLNIDYKKNALELFYHPNMITPWKTTAAPDSLTIQQYCNRTKETKFQVLFPLLELMIKNKFTSISPAGPGDCGACSVIIFNIENKAFLIKDLKNRCMPEDCYDKEKKEKMIKLTDSIFLIKNKEL